MDSTKTLDIKTCVVFNFRLAVHACCLCLTECSYFAINSFWKIEVVPPSELLPYRETMRYTRTCVLLYYTMSVAAISWSATFHINFAQYVFELYDVVACYVSSSRAVLVPCFVLLRMHRWNTSEKLPLLCTQ